MGVYIKGMEMPKVGVYICELGVLEEQAAVFTIHTPIDEPQRSYKLIPVPDHGRLIDAFRLFNRVDEIKKGVKTEKERQAINKVLQEIVNAPTVVEAGGE